MPRDRELVQDSLRGDLKAFAALVDRYRYAVFGLCLSYMRDRDTAEDAAQEAFIKAFLQLRSLADPDRFAPWLKQIAANECRMWRRRQRDQIPLDRAPTDELATPQKSSDDELASTETRRRILAALGKLNPVQQQIVTLFYLEELSLKQIAAFLDIPFQTANQRLYRARIRMKEEMLKMVEETLGQQKLPENFTDEVIAAALERGRQLLEERRWPEAKAEFRKITATMDDHLEAQRGLALALDGEVNAMLEDADLPNDEKLVQEAIVALEEAYRLGARDGETVWSLAEFYWNQYRHGDRADLLESYAAETDDVGQGFRALVRAALSARKVPDMERAFSLHRRALALDGVPLKDRLTAYFATPLAIYRETGNGDTWLAETEALYAQLGLPLTIVHYMYFRDRMSILMRMERYEEALQTGRLCLDLLEREEVDDPPQRRWWRSDTLGEFIQIYDLMDDAEGLTRTLEEARENLRSFESEWKAAIEGEIDAQRHEELDREYRRFVAHAVHNLGAACSRTGCFDEAIVLFERSMEFREVGPAYMFLAAAHMKNGDPAGALAAMRRMRQSASPKVQRWLFVGEAERWFRGDETFAPVHEDGEFAELVRAKEES